MFISVSSRLLFIGKPIYGYSWGDGAVAIINYGNRVLGLISIMQFWTFLYPNFASLAVVKIFQKFVQLCGALFIEVVCLLPLCGLIACFRRFDGALVERRFCSGDTQVVAKCKHFI